MDLNDIRVYLPRTVAEMLIDWKKGQELAMEELGDEYHDYQLVMILSGLGNKKNVVFTGLQGSWMLSNGHRMQTRILAPKRGVGGSNPLVDVG